MDLLLVRHGESEGNKQKFVQGWRDTPLTPLGRKQARLVARKMRQYLPLDVIYASPLQRAWDTAAAIAKVAEMSPIVTPELREMHFGEVEGLTHEQWQARYPELLTRWANPDDLDFGWPGGESRRQFAARVTTAIAAITTQHPSSPRILIVCHGGVISTYLSTILHGSPSHWREYQVGNCSLSLVRFTTPAAPELVLLNDETHIGAADSEDETADDEAE